MEQEVAELFAHVDRLALRHTDVAALCGIAAQTVRFCEVSGRLPRRARQRKALLRLLERLREAGRRSDLSLEDCEVTS
jgi:hypothetical protein